MIRDFEHRVPRLHPTAYVEASASLIGEVILGEQASVWFGAVVRADINRIEIGARSNVQDLSVLHVTEEWPIAIAEDVTLGHRVTVHGARIGRGSLIGIGAIVLDGVEIGAESLVAAGSVVTPGTKVPPRSLVMGIPGKVLRPLTDAELERIGIPTRNYVGYTERYRRSASGA